MTFLIPLFSTTKVTRQFTDSDAQTSVSRVFTRTMSFGAADPSRRIVIVYSATANTTPSSQPSFDDISIDGSVGAIHTISVQRSTGRIFGMFCAHVPTGTNGSVVIRYNHGGSLTTSSRVAAAYRVVGAGSNVPYDWDTVGGSASFDVPALGVAIGGAMWSVAPPGANWIGGLSLDTREGNTSFASDEFEDAVTPKTVNISNSPNHGAFASWAPG